MGRTAGSGDAHGRPSPVAATSADRRARVGGFKPADDEPAPMAALHHDDGYRDEDHGFEGWSA